MVREYLQREWALVRFIRAFDPHVVTAAGGGLMIAPASKLAGRPSIVFSDTDHVLLDRFLAFPWVTLLCTPKSFRADFGGRQLRYAGFQELAYLHPQYFKPDARVLQQIGLAPETPFVVLRFVSWQAAHDIGAEGFSLSQKLEAVRRLEQFGRVFISSEAGLPAELQSYQVAVPPHDIHHLLAFARLYMGEGATMASESALLGTPSIYVNSLPLGYISELQDDYGLVHWYRDGWQALDRAIELLKEEDVKECWRAKRDRMLAEKEDVTARIVTVLEDWGQRLANAG